MLETFFLLSPLITTKDYSKRTVCDTLNLFYVNNEIRTHKFSNSQTYVLLTRAL